MQRQRSVSPTGWFSVALVAVFFGLLSLVPLLFWIGIFGVAALVVAMVFAYKDVVGAWRNPVSKIASFMMIGSLVAFFDRFYNIPMGLMETH